MVARFYESSELRERLRQIRPHVQIVGGVRQMVFGKSVRVSVIQAEGVRKYRPEGSQTPCVLCRHYRRAIAAIFVSGGCDDDPYGRHTIGACHYGCTGSYEFREFDGTTNRRCPDFEPEAALVRGESA